MSLLIKDIPAFIEEASEQVRQQWVGARLSVYGHLGDGNIHFNVLAPEASAPESFKAAHAPAISLMIHDRVMAARGSFSAEHGIGQMKRDLLLRYSDPVALDLMRAIKAAFDPCGLMNPGKVIPERSSNE